MSTNESEQEFLPARRRAKRAGIADVAKLAGVSTTTVSYILNNTPPYASQFSKETRDRVLRAAEELSYRPNLFAAGLRGHVSALFGVFLGESRGDEESWMPQITALLEGVTDASEELDLLPIIRVGRKGKGPEEAAVVQRLVRTGVSGILTQIPSPDLAEELQRLHRKRFPFLVLYGCGFEGRFRNWIDVDNVEFGRQIARLLVEKGHKKIACVYDDKDQPHANLRLKGFKEVLAEAGIELSPKRMLGIPWFAKGETEVEFENSVSEFYLRDHTAVGCLTLGCTILTRNVCATHKIAIPDRLSVAAAEADLLPALPWPTATTVTVSWSYVGQQGVKILNRMMQEEAVDLPVLVAPHIRQGTTIRDAG